MTYHPFHLVEQRPWPLSSSLRAFILTSRLINFFHHKIIIFLILRLFFIFLNIYQWWRDVRREATFQGFHTIITKNGLKWGIILFILREILFFFRFFWSFFHTRLSPDLEIGSLWPPKGISPFNPYNIPLLNTCILLSSGVSITWSHHRILNKNYSNAFISLILTIILGIYFTILQTFEYLESPFTISDRIFGTTFFVATGFHGLHVIIGTRFLIINSFRIYIGHFSSNHHFSFEAAAWYWHFVDIVWLFLFSFIYWWIYYLISIKKYI
jgi:cytochrome c oxidase subunit 3